LFSLAAAEATDALLWGGAALRTSVDPPNSIAANNAVMAIEAGPGQLDFGTVIGERNFRIGLTSSVGES
jgi:hypothetical protein